MARMLPPTREGSKRRRAMAGPVVALRFVRAAEAACTDGNIGSDLGLPGAEIALVLVIAAPTPTAGAVAAVRLGSFDSPTFVTAAPTTVSAGSRRPA
ncbi:hypothetical protein [Tepidamorphus gemmatus]|jgi:hypothetical protein|uniref:hypothetical protein n=1 Tax=Tepidamorphus gemmatus TaxID=747076 RepID=UPI0010513A37|nr:hypothetical protein [Tepidamorphus gemmatus]